MPKEPTQYQTFTQLDIRVGTITDCKNFEEARNPAYQCWIDFGSKIGTKKSSAQITAHYTPDKLIGRQVIAIINFPTKQIGKFMSECLILGSDDGNGIRLLTVENKVPNGQIVH